MALTKSAPAGILLSVATFGAAHAYQGFRMVIMIGLYGVMFGILAYLARKRSPWNDRPCVAGFVEWSACEYDDTLAKGASCNRRVRRYET